MRSLEKRAVDSLVEQLLAQMEGARIVGPSGTLSVLDAQYVGPLKVLLMDAIPGIPPPLLASVRDDLIVVKQAAVETSALVSFEPSTLRVAKPFHNKVPSLKEKFGEPLNVTIQRGRHLDTDWNSPILTFTDQWFAPRSIRGWARLSLHLARLCASVEEMKTRSGLKQKEIFYEDRDTNLLTSQLLSARTGELIDL